MRVWVLALALLLAGPAAAVDTDYVTVQRGRSLTDAGDCMPCHTIPGGTPFAGGRAIQTPFGTMLSPNLTPDNETGIGAWSDDQFVRAVTKGLGPGGEHLYPAMPYTYYTRVTEGDLLAIRAYLKTLDPVHNRVQTDQLPFPFSIRQSLYAWNALFYRGGAFRPDPQQSPEWNRGAYLVQGLGHCAACHTAKDWLGGDETSRALQGGVIQGWFAPNLTGDARAGLGGWSIDDVAEYLATGHNRFAAASGPMAEVVAYSTSKLTDADRRAIALYLKGLPGNPQNPAPVADLPAGSDLYVDNCSACHNRDGSGMPKMFPALAHGPFVQSADPTSLIRVVLLGQRSVATAGAPTAPAMPAFGWKFNDSEVAAVLTYIRNTWGNAAAPVSASDVRSERAKLEDDPAQ